MNIKIAASPQRLGQQAAHFGATCIQKAIETKGHAQIVVSAGASQFDLLRSLSLIAGVDWSKVTGFQLAEFVGLSDTHPSSYRRFVRDCLVSRTNLPVFHYLKGKAAPEEECNRVGSLIRKQSIDVAFIDIGNNGSLGFHMPPADFNTQNPYEVIEVDRESRLQQLGRGWFRTFKNVPSQVICMTIPEILRASCVICSVAHERMASTIKETVEKEVSALYPSTILKKHANAHLFLDAASASKLELSPQKIHSKK